MEFTGADHEQTAKIQLEIAKAIRPFAHNTEAALAVAALLRCARVLIRRYPLERQTALVDAAQMYLEGRAPDETILPFHVTTGGLITPN